MRRTLLIACFLLLFTADASAQAEVPSLTGRIMDRAGILSAETEAELDALLAAHERATSNQVAVLTVPSLQGEAIEAYALRVARTWALGTADYDNGVLILVAVEDREMRIEVGYGLEGALPDVVAARIIRHEMVPRFREGDFDAGVLAGAHAVVGALEGTYAPPEASGEMPPFWAGLLFMILPGAFASLALILPGGVRWFLFFFLMPFFFVSGLFITATGGGAGLILLLYVAAFIGLSFHPKVRALREKMREAKEKNTTVKIGPFTFMPGASGGGGGWSGGSGGGGSSFSGGGGSFGGGGASGRW